MPAGEVHTPRIHPCLWLATKAEADAVFDQLSADPAKQQCGWLAV